MSNPLLPLMYGPAGRAIVVDASGRLVFNGDSGADQYVFGYGSTGRSIAIDASGRLLLSPDSVNVLSGTDTQLRTDFENASGVWTESIENVSVADPSYVVWNSQPYGTNDGALQINHGLASGDFDFFTVTGRSEEGGYNGGTCRGHGPIDFAQAGSVIVGHTTGYVMLASGYIRANSNATDAQFTLNSWNDNVGINHLGTNVNFRAIKIPAGNQVFDSGPIAVNINSVYTVAHNLGVEPTLYVVELMQHGDGHGWRVQMMCSAWWNGAAFAGGVCAVDSNNFVVRFKNFLTQFRDYAGSTANITSLSYMRIVATDWAPDYDSGWQAITATNNTKYLQHNLGKIPGLWFLEVGELNNGSGIRTPSMASYLNGNNTGTTVYTINPYNTKIKSGSTYVYRVYDKNDVNKNATSGYYRWKCWR